MPAPEIVADVVADPLDVAAAVDRANDPSCGGIGIFVGTVRTGAAERDRDDVIALEYDAHPDLAPAALRAIATEAAAKWALAKVVALHRTGRCDVGAPTVVVACAAAHRAEALDACRWVIDEIKQRVPIWKKEIYEDGSAWVGAGAAT